MSRLPLHRVLTLIGCALLAACAATPQEPIQPGVNALLHDAEFAPPSMSIDPGEVFRLSPEMVQFIADAKNPQGRSGDARRRLIELLYRDKQNIEIDYDASVTRTAAQTFQMRSGNCLSLMIMTAALARRMDLPVQFRSVDIDEFWSRNGDLLFASGHVNIALEKTGNAMRLYSEPDYSLVVDFVPASEMRGQRARPIGESTVMAMFMNNRAAEAMATGSIADAYWYAREAIRQEPRFLTAFNTLGVIYLRQGQPGWARSVFEAVLDREPDNVKVMGNLVGALQALGRSDDAAQLAARLARIDPHPPYHYFNAGIEAMRTQDFASARELFSKEIARQAYNPEFHFWLAQADFRLGQWRDARRHLELAVKNSTTPRDHAIYTAKLDWLRGQNTH